MKHYAIWVRNSCSLREDLIGMPEGLSDDEAKARFLRYRQEQNAMVGGDYCKSLVVKDEHGGPVSVAWNGGWREVPL